MIRASFLLLRILHCGGRQEETETKLPDEVQYILMKSSKTVSARDVVCSFAALLSDCACLFVCAALGRAQKKVRVMHSGIHDWGLFALENLPPNTMVRLLGAPSIAC